MFKREMKWEILRIEILLNVKTDKITDKIRKMTESKKTKIRERERKTEKVR